MGSAKDYQEMAQARRAAQAVAVVELEGGQVRSTEEIQTLLDAVATAVLRGEIDPYRGQVLTGIYGKLADVKLKHDLEKRIEQLEERASDRSEAWKR